MLTIRPPYVMRVPRAYRPDRTPQSMQNRFRRSSEPAGELAEAEAVDLAETADLASAATPECLPRLPRIMALEKWDAQRILRQREQVKKSRVARGWWEGEGEGEEEEE